MAPLSIACNPASSAGEGRVTPDTPHPSSLIVYLQDQQHHPSAKGEPVSEFSPSLQDENTSVSIILVLALPRAPQESGAVPHLQPPPAAGFSLTSPKVLFSSLHW